MDSHVPSNPNDAPWTEEKHVNFLNSMESWFVRTMLDKNDRSDLRLDRQLPDSCESTLDSKQNVRKRNKYSSPVVYIGRNGSRINKGRLHKISRRPPYQSHHSLQDQVVPQFENRREDEDEKEPPKFSASSMAETN